MWKGLSKAMPKFVNCTFKHGCNFPQKLLRKSCNSSYCLLAGFWIIKLLYNHQALLLERIQSLVLHLGLELHQSSFPATPKDM